MVLFCALWTFVFYMFWLTVRPQDNNSGPFPAFLTGCVTTLVRFLIPELVNAYGFGLSRFASAFADHTSLPVLFPLIVALLISRFYPQSGITDFTGFILLAMTPVSIARAVSLGVRHDALRLVLTPLLWTAFAAGIYPLVQLFKGGPLHKIAAIPGIAVLLLLPPLVWLDFFRHSYIEGAALLLAALAPMFVLCIVSRKNLDRGRLELTPNNQYNKSGER